MSRHVPLLLLLLVLPVSLDLQDWWSGLEPQDMVWAV